jgi:hypothetical protein
MAEVAGSGGNSGLLMSREHVIDQDRDNIVSRRGWTEAYTEF